MSSRPSYPARRGPRKTRRAARCLLLEHLEERRLLAIITVDTTSDGGGPGTTLRAAITQANTDPGSTINFQIPGAGPFLIQPLTPLPAIAVNTLIDGTSQLGFTGTPVIEINGSLAGSSASGLVLDSGATSSTIEALSITGFGSGGTGVGIQVQTSSVQIIGNYIGVDPTGAAKPNFRGIELDEDGNTVGGTTVGSQNVISGNTLGAGIYVAGSVNVIEGNLIGLTPDGSQALANQDGIFIASGVLNTIGGTTAAERNVISGNADTGITIAGVGTVVDGNYIGIDTTGSLGVANGGPGISITGSGNKIGVSAANVISANTGDGILIDGMAATGNMVEGNLIGTDPSGLAGLGNSGNGVSIQNSASNNFINDTNGIGNTIAFNTGAGVRVGMTANGTEANNSILNNSIFSNGALGIDLGNAGVTPNTPGGPHLGPNQLQNFPIVLSATFTGANTLVTGTLNSTPSQTFLIQIYANASIDPSGFGQGQTLLGETSVTTDPSTGDAAFTIPLGPAPINQRFITATATDPSGNTSEFSQAFPQVSPLVVTNTNDSGTGSLRQVILNANATVGPATITFNIPGNGVHTILPQSDLPVITHSVTIDGTSQPGYAGTPLIVIDGSQAGAGATGLEIGPNAPGSQVEALSIGNFAFAGIDVEATNTLIVSSYIGVNATGATAIPNTFGVILATAGNTIGGTTAAARNVISGNLDSGVLIGPGANNVILGNYIGTNAAGTGAIPNVDGIDIDDSSNNTIGGTTPGARNVISGNTQDGIQIESDGLAPAANNLILGNYIGTDASGANPLGNGDDGVNISGASNNTVGGTTAAARNIIAASGLVGVEVSSTASPGASGNLIEGNYIGTDAGGTNALGNGVGVSIFASSNNTVGSTNIGAGNVISGNTTRGVSITGTALIAASSNEVAGNFIGTDPTGLVALGSQGDGVVIVNASGNFIGAPTLGTPANVISGNANNGVVILVDTAGLSASSNVVQGNYIGTDVNGTLALGNHGDGVLIQDASGNFIGEFAVDLVGGNLISGNQGNGIRVAGIGVAPAANNSIMANLIGTDVTGAAALANGQNGVQISSSSNNFVGGSSSGGRNVISGNALDGVLINSPTTPGSSGNLIQGNYIGTAANGTTALGNQGGVAIVASSANTVGGTFAAVGNVISGNAAGGVFITGLSGTTSNNLVGANLIGTDPSGLVAVANQGDGIAIADASGNTIGGTLAGSANLISGNTGNGVSITLHAAGTAAANNLILGNLIGTNKGGAASLANHANGVLILNASANTVGGTATGSGNTISGNTQDGVLIQSDGTAPASNNVIAGNLIGTNSAGGLAVANGADGVGLDAAVSNAIGGAGLASNVISGNNGRGVNIFNGSDTNTVQGNLIGTDKSGLNALGNRSQGVEIAGSTGNLIGGTAAGVGNLISANIGAGVDISGGGTGNIVQGNSIGTQLGGTGALGNQDVGVVVTASNNTIGGSTFAARNIIASNASNGVALNGSNNLVSGNFIGVDSSGAGLGNQGDGVFVGGSNNTIGGPSAAAGNLISGNTQYGVRITGATNLVAGNLIGTNASGAAALGNGVDGVAISGAGATGNTVGGTSLGSVNLISGNFGAGVDIFAQATGNLVLGNFIGTDLNGTFAIANGLSGVQILDASGNTIGGTARNLISGNLESGVLIESDATASPAANNVIAGNNIGVNAGGTAALGNQISGVFIQSASNNTIGSSTVGLGNLISGNLQGGIRIVGTLTLPATGNQVIGNEVGTTADGLAAVGNGLSGDGVLIQDSSSNTVGGTAAGAGNLISGNAGAGISIVTAGGTTPKNNLILGNRIGTDTTGTASVGNAIGVQITAGAANTIGGTTTAAENIISGNTAQGVLIVQSGLVLTQNNVVEGNLIGTDRTGAKALANLGGGVAIQDASSNTVGGTVTGTGNVISGNTGAGVVIQGHTITPAQTNVIAGNFIGTDSTGKLALGNSSDGVQLTGASTNTVGGVTVAARNVISANGGDGVLVRNSGDTASTNNAITGNFIGIDVTGLVGVDANNKTLGNAKSGVELQGASGTFVGGFVAGSGNVLSNNGLSGVTITSAGNIDNNLIVSNLIGTDATGTKALGNLTNGVNIGSSYGNVVGGSGSSGRNVISGNLREGVFIGFVGSTLNPANEQITDNYIGTDITGTKSLGNGLSGVSLVNAVGVTIGGTFPGAGNLISGNGTGTQPGIGIAGTSQNNLVAGNLIGTDVTGLAPIGGSSSLSNLHGIVLNDAGNETIGGTTATAGNTIAFNVNFGIYVFSSAGSPATGTLITGNTINANGSDGVKLQTAAGQVLSTQIQKNVITGNLLNGVWVDGPSNNAITQNTISGNTNDGVKVTSGTGNSILTNSIFSNANLSIELEGGGNNSQPSPVLTSATVSGTTTTIVGTLQAAPNTLYRVQFFSSPSSPPPGFGDGKTFLGEATNVLTDASGLANINATVPVAVAADQFITSTATNQTTNNTSQISRTSPNLLLTLTAQPEPVNQTQNLTYTITVANNGPSPTTGVTVTDTLPTGVTFISATGGGTLNGKVVTFPAVDLKRGDTIVYTIIVRADTAGTITNTATATYTNEGNNPDIDPTKLTRTVTSTVNPVANIAVTGVADQASVQQGSNLTYTDTVVNNGPSPSAGVILTDTLPAGVTFVSATGGVTPVGNVLTFHLGNLAAGGMASVTIVVQPTTVGTIVNTGTVTSTTTDLGAGPHTFSVSTTVTPLPPSFVILNTNDSGVGSLRQVILDVNAVTDPAPITIGIQIPGSGPNVIQPTSALPAITHALVLNAVPTTGFNGTAPFVIDGSKIPTGAAPSNVALTPGLLDVNAPNVVLKGITIFGFNGFGIVLDTKSGNDVVASDNIGTNLTGTAAPNPNTIGGVLVLSANNTIGGTTAGDANVISGNPYGVYIQGAGATGNVVIGNLIGTDRSGTNILGSNAEKIDGIEIDGASGNKIGLPTSSPGTPPGNLIEGYQAGIYLFGGASNNLIQGNAIRANGITTANNSGQELGGILLAAANNNQITNNDLSNNTGSGIVIFNNAMNNVVTSNTITKNSSTGVFIVGGSGNMIGLNGAGNGIANNGGSGVDLEGAGTTNNRVLANLIQGNGENGVYAFKAPNNTIGGSNSGDGNVIQNNGFNGVELDGSGANGNIVQGNTIANQANGYGVLLNNGATANIIGGSGGAANSFQNNALGNVQVLVNGLPPSGITGGNTIGPNNGALTGNALTAAKHKKKRHQIKVIHHIKAPHHVTRHHPHGPRAHTKKRVGGY